MLLECLKHGLEKETEIPRLIQKVLGNKKFDSSTNMRSKEEILKDYGLSLEV